MFSEFRTGKLAICPRLSAMFCALGGRPEFPGSLLNSCPQWLAKVMNVGETRDYYG